MAHLLPETWRIFPTCSLCRPCIVQADPSPLPTLPPAPSSSPPLMTLTSCCHSCAQPYTWPQCLAPQRSVCMCVFASPLPLAPNQQEPCPHPSCTSTLYHRCWADAPSTMSMAAKPREEPGLQNGTYRTTKVGGGRHEQMCSDSMYLHFPSLKMCATIHSTDSAQHRHPLFLSLSWRI